MGFLNFGGFQPNFMNPSFGDDVIGRDANATAGTPGQTPEEAALLREQTALLQQQRDALTRQLGMQDLLFSQLGFTRKDDGTWEMTGPQAEINTLMQDRTLRALRGELPVSSAFTRDRDEQRRTLGDIMSRNLGTGWETSTPGIQALSEFDAETQALTESIREGVLTNNEALINNRNARVTGAVTNPNLVAAGGTLANVFSSPLSSMLQRAGLGNQTSIANLNAATQRLDSSLDYIGGLHNTNMSSIFGR